MKLNKSAYLFAAALVASTMGMTSCSSEVDDLTTQWEGKTTNATIGFSLSGLPGTRSSASNVNLDGDATIAEISNVAVIPMIGETPTTPIKFGSITGLTTDGSLTQPQTRSLQSTVDRFIVYGNMPQTVYNDLKESATPNLSGIKFELSSSESLNVNGAPTAVYAPHGLYYYRDTNTPAPGKEATGYYTGTGDNWESVSWGGAPQTGAIQTATNIKISDVRYAVGVLATAVFQNDATNKVFCGATEEVAQSGKIFADYGTPVKVTGIVIYDQNKTLKYNFDATGSEVVPVYDTDVQTEGGALATTKLSEAQKTGANFYTVVAPTAAGKGIGISIEFTVAEGAKMVTTSGTYTAGQKFYMQATLAPETSTKSVFAAATSTMLNATVTDWGKATADPQKPTDTNVGIEFDASWIQGVIYNVNI